MKKKIAVLTGAGVSAESGISTFRDNGGLWDKYDVNDVASIEGWYRNRKLVLDFYNIRREELEKVRPNGAHLAIAGLEKDYDEHIRNGKLLVEEGKRNLYLFFKNVTCLRLFY